MLSAIFANAQQSYNITFTHDSITVFGTFTVPSAAGRFPTIIIDPGSGDIDRDGTIQFFDGNSACIYPGLYGKTIKMYKELADAFVDSGYAVLRYDKLEYTYAPGNLGALTFHKLWLPVESAIDYVKTRTDVDTNNIILIGHSEGSTMIPYIAKNRNDVKALISLAGARTPFDSLVAWQYNQLYQLLEPCGATFSDSLYLANLARQTLDYFHVIRTNWNQNTPDYAGVPAASWYDYIVANDEVADNYNQVNLPTLFIGLGLDLNVPPSELVRFQQDVTITDDFWSLAGLVHYCCTPDVAHVSEEVPHTIVYWLRQHNIQTSVKPISCFNENWLNVSPNPFSSSISIKTEQVITGKSSMAIYDVYGKRILMKELHVSKNEYTETIDLSYLPDGIYFLEASSGNYRTLEKIVKN